MAATNYTPIQLYNSGTTGNAPSAGNLAAGELAINYADGKLFYKDNSAAVQVIAWKTTPTTAGGTGLTSYTAGDLPYYASGTAFSKLAIGSANYVLTSSGSAPQYVAQSTLSVGNATNAANVGTTDNTSSSSTYYPTLVSATSGNNPITTSSTKLSFIPNTGVLSTTGLNLSGLTASSAVATDSSKNLISVTNTGTGNNVLATSPTLVTPLLGTPTSGTLTNCTGLPLSSGVTGTLPVGNGGTGQSSITAGYIPIGNGASAVTLSSNLYFNPSTNQFGVNTGASPSYNIDVGGSGHISNYVNQSEYIGWIIQNTNGGGVASAGIQFGANDGNGGKITAKQTGSPGSSSSSMLFFVYNGSSYVQGMSLSNTGALSITGALSKGSGSFRIDHPLPQLNATHELVHSFVEAPQADLYYRGSVVLNNGTASINIDSVAGMTEGTFDLLCREVQCFTSNESDWDAVKGSVSGNILTIQCQNTSSTATVSWIVIGERKDKHMYDTHWTDVNGKVIVEPLKPKA